MRSFIVLLSLFLTAAILISQSQIEACFGVGEKCIRNMNEIEEFFQQLLFNFRGKLGCAGAYICDEATNEMKKMIIKSGLSKGFQKFEIVDTFSMLYLTTVSQSKYKPKNNDIVWIFSGDICTIWKKVDEKALLIAYGECSTNFGIETLIAHCRIDKDANIVFHMDSKITIDSLKKIFPKCYIVSFVQQSAQFGALLKARLLANDVSVIDFDVVNSHCNVTLVKGGEQIVLHLEANTKLPFKKSKRLKTNKNNNKLTILDVSAEKPVYQENLPLNDEIILTITIDQNGIFYVNHEKVSPSENGSTQKGPITFEEDLLPRMLGNTNQVNILGIDLGTSRCCAAVNRKNGICTVPLDNQGQRLLPSYVSYDEKHPKCGQVVVDHLRNFAKFTVFDSKRLIGKTLNDIEIDSIWPFQLASSNDNIILKVKSAEGEKEIDSEEIATVLLKHIKRKTEEFQGEKNDNIVITIPAAFSKRQEEATFAAARKAGWKNIKLLLEPIAAALAYFVDRPIPNNSKILLFDLGGGTLDVCIFKIIDNEAEIISNTGDSKMGGRDFDKILINYFKHVLSSKHAISITGNKIYKLMLNCQNIKESLSATDYVSLDVFDYDPSQNSHIPITRKEFESMSKALINKIQNTINASLYNSGYDASQINKVLQVGGGSRMPMIKNLLKRLFPNAEQCCEEHPDEVVAIGAAYYAYKKFSNIF